jgi:hypothetical protein
MSLNTTSENVTTQRAPASSYINVGSDDRFPKLTDGTPDYSKGFQPITNFTINLQQAISFAQPRRFAVTQIYFPYYLPNLTPQNCALTLQLDGPTLTTLPETFIIIPNFAAFLSDPFATILTGTEIAAAVEASVLAQGGVPYTGFQCVWIPRTSSFYLGIFPQSLGVNVRVLPTAPGTYPLPAPFTGTTVITTDLRKVMGFDTPALWQVPDSYLGPAPIPGVYFPTLYGGYTSLNQTNYIDFCSTRITQYQRIADTDTNKSPGQVIARLYVPPCNGQAQTLIYEPQTPKYIAGNPDQFLASIDIQLRNDIGTAPYFPGPIGSVTSQTGSVPPYNEPTASGQEFYITLLVSES